MSRSKGRSPLHEARNSAQLIYLMICICLPYVPHGGLRPCDGIYHHCICSFDVWGVPASQPKPCDRLYHCEKGHNARMQLSQTVMPVLWDDGVFHTVADILSQSHWWWTSMACLECFTMRRFYHDALVATSEVVTWTMPYSKQSSSSRESWFQFSPEVTTKDQCQSCWWFSRWLIFSVERLMI